jgi:hypothetical protein
VRGYSILSTQTCGAAVLRRTVGRAKALRRCRRMAGHEWGGFWVREERLTASCSAISLSDAGQIEQIGHLALFSVHGAASTHARSKPI